MRAPSPFSERRLSPSFLRTTPAKNPRTECGCHPVHCMMLAIVAPLGRCSSPSTRICFECGRVKRQGNRTSELGEEAGKVVVLPSGEFELAPQGGLGVVLAHDIESQM